MKNWFRRLYLSIVKFADTKWGPFALFSAALADASFFPLPVTTFFIILILSNNKMTFKYIILVVTGTMAGAFLGYSIGRFIWLKPNGDLSGVANFLFNNIPGFSKGIYEKVHTLYIKWDFWILGAATTTPLPYGMFSVASGVFNMNIPVFLLATLISQGIKFFFLGILTLKLGQKVRDVMELNWKPAVIVTACLVIAIVVSNVIKA
jgi:membrane protein YqaA with SNARE-associated domain